MAEDVEAKIVPAVAETRCRYCWGRVYRGDEVKPVGNVRFHVECPTEITPFPMIGSIDDKGEPLVEPPDDPYARQRYEVRFGR